MKQEQKVALKTMAIKARVANFIRKELYKARLDQVTKERKIELFDKIFKMNHEMHHELKDYKFKREYKAYIHKARVKRGYKFKIKTPNPKINLAVSK